MSTPFSERLEFKLILISNSYSPSPVVYRPVWAAVVYTGISMASGLRWSHATNTKAQLIQALKGCCENALIGFKLFVSCVDGVDMVEADIR